MPRKADIAFHDSLAALPMSRDEMVRRGWTELDVLLVTGDAYIDHPAFGVALLGRLLEAEGLRVGVLAQPDWRDPDAFRVMGRPRLFAAISAGAMDSMVNRYTAAKKVRNDDAYSPGGRAGRRPNRATIAYTAAVKGAFPGLATVIGGLEASLRRLAHYDYWDDRVRRSILVDSKADRLLFGMAETALVALARRLATGEPLAAITDLPGTARLASQPPPDAVVLPAYAKVAADKEAYGQAFRLAYEQASPLRGRPLAQEHERGWVVVNPPAVPLKESELDRIYALPFTRRPHPAYTETIPAYEQIKFSVTSHRGCFGGCAFCAITHHQGRTIQSRSAASIRAEVDELARHPEFRGTVTDVGGPTANMYGLGCSNPEAEAVCRRESCLYPDICTHLGTDDGRLTDLLKDLRQHPEVKHLFVASGIRFDLLARQPDYFDALLTHHVGGLLKVAPESTRPEVLRIMRKPGAEAFEKFLANFRRISRRRGKRQAVVPYFISGHPGCTLEAMVDVALFLQRHNLRVEQVQEFTPTPGSLATCIYHTGRDPLSGEKVHVPRSTDERRLQKALLLYHLPENLGAIREVARKTGRTDVLQLLAGGTQAPGDRSTAPDRKPSKGRKRAGRRQKPRLKGG